MNQFKIEQTKQVEQRVKSFLQDICVKINILNSDIYCLHDILDCAITSTSPDRREVPAVLQDSQGRFAHIRETLKSMSDALEYCEAMFNQISKDNYDS